MRKLLLACWLMLLLAGICSLFWYNEWKYSLPTPVPQNYAAVNMGDYVQLGSSVPFNSDKPLFVHFFNPDCPCSKFNIPHFQSLVKKYNDKFSFLVVVINQTSKNTADEIRDKYDLRVPVVCDSTIARACGVYSTPQAVILASNHQLYYKGNYNRSRYCTDKSSNYAEMAIQSFLNNENNPLFSQYALKAYGCQVAYCKK